MRRVLAAFGFLAVAAVASPASASVTYQLDALIEGFTFKTANFITSSTHVDAGSLSSCSAVLSSCTSIDFAPEAKTRRGDVDELRFNTSFLDLVPVTLKFTFQDGAFGKAGHYVALNGLSTLDVSVSAVPLPASAPLFGAALLALAGFGCGINRRIAPKTQTAA